MSDDSAEHMHGAASESSTRQSTAIASSLTGNFAYFVDFGARTLVQITTARLTVAHEISELLRHISLHLLSLLEQLSVSVDSASFAILYRQPYQQRK